MIVVKLMGGLGNQLFQYAAGRSLAAKHGTELGLDLSFLNENSEFHTKRDFALDVFNLDYKICTLAESNAFTKPSFLNKHFSFAFPIKFLANEKSFEFDDQFFSYPSNTYLNGFWQSEKYFISIRDILINELKTTMEFPEQKLDIKNAILRSNSVSLHVRRGDYVTNKNAQTYHGNIDGDYYYKAIGYLSQKYADLKFFIFSDDMTWVRSNLKIPGAHFFVEPSEGRRSVLDLELMSLCKHNIIANSSFSWWGAWLNQNNAKMVIAPNQWFVNKKIKTNDLIPENWIKI